MNFESAQVASAVLGCEGEDLHTAVFKHHLRQLLQRATGAVRECHIAEEQEEGWSHWSYNKLKMLLQFSFSFQLLSLLYNSTFTNNMLKSSALQYSPGLFIEQ